MSVLIDDSTRVMIQGITGDVGAWSAQDLAAYGTQVVAGMVPGKGGTAQDGVPVFDFASDAATETGANAALVYVPPSAAAEAIVEVFESGFALVVYPGDGLPVHEAMRLRRLARKFDTTFVGANTPGVISPDKAKLGFMPSYCYMPGPVGVVSKSGSLSYEVCWRLSAGGIGQSTVVGVGGDPIKGLSIGEALRLFDNDPETSAIMLLGEIGGTEEYQAVEYALRADSKPMAACLVGRTAPPGRKLGHAGALIGGDREGYTAKVSSLEGAGVRVARRLEDIVPIVHETLATATVS